MIFDVQALIETPVGNKILTTELRGILEDVKILKVGHVGIFCRLEPCALPADPLEFTLLVPFLLSYEVCLILAGSLTMG